MPSIAEIVLRARDEASDDIRRVATNLRSLDRAATGETIKLGGTRGLTALPQQARGGTKALDRMAGSALSLASGFGVATSIAEFAQLGVSAVQSANSLERTQATVQALAGSTAAYAQVLALARANQDRFGGSLQSNIEGLGGMLVMAKSTGASLADLDNISRKLAFKSPEQGGVGARTAVSELLSNEGSAATMSLARRFEIPPNLLAPLEQAGLSATEKL